MKTGGSNSLNVRLPVENEHKNRRHEKQDKNQPDVSEKFNTPFQPVFPALFGARPIGDLQLILHAVTVAYPVPRKFTAVNR